MDRLPVLERVVVIDPREIDERRVVPRFVTDDVGAVVAAQVHRKPQALVSDQSVSWRIVLHVDQRLLVVQSLEFTIRGRRIPTPQPELVQPHSLLHHNAEGARDDFGIQFALVARGHAFEFAAVVRNEARKNVEASGGAFGIGFSGNVRRQAQLFHQRRHVGAAALQHRRTR